MVLSTDRVPVGGLGCRMTWSNIRRRFQNAWEPAWCGWRVSVKLEWWEEMIHW